MIWAFHIPDGSSWEHLWGPYPREKFPEESTPEGAGADWAKCHNRWCMYRSSDCVSQMKSASSSQKMLSALPDIECWISKNKKCKWQYSSETNLHMWTKIKKKLAKIKSGKETYSGCSWEYVERRCIYWCSHYVNKYLDGTDVIPWQRKLAFFLFFFLINTLRAVFPCLQWKLKNAPTYSGNKFNAIPKGNHS